LRSKPKISLDHLDDNDVDVQPMKALKIKPNKLSMDDENTPNPQHEFQPDVRLKKKLKQTIRMRTPSPVLSYSNDKLLKLKAQQLHKPQVTLDDNNEIDIEAHNSFIPSELQIEQMKQARQAKLNAEPAAFISLDEKDGQVAKNVRESRLVTEDQHDEETFEDYKDMVLFGSDSIKEATRLKMKEMEDARNEIKGFRQEEDEDEWELQMIHRGIDERHVADGQGKSI
jgi:Nineteen complex-related protein 2